ncbi:MBL fold metallo-hydrolase [Xanthobacter sp. KR7-225]|uniref:MBL fold metallo-hydrolase n=1 Tax=Xanthobacter sp. KR7-225 TaxID=3156613 RepID=UPI0032B5FAFB
MLKLTLLGTGTPTPSLRRACSGYLIRCGADVILFDHGFGAYARMLELGIAPAQVTHLFLSHLHYDHMGDVARLVLTRWDQGGGRIGELDVFGPPPTAAVFAALFGKDGAFGPDLTARTRNRSSLDVYRARGGTGERRWPAPKLREVDPGAEILGDGWKVTVARAHHCGPELDCRAYRIDAAGRSIVYSGDSGPSEAVCALAQDADVLIHMCHYMSGSAPSEEFAASNSGHLEVARLAQKARVRTLVLTHITEQLDRPGVRERVVREVGDGFGGTVVFGEDLVDVPFEAPQFPAPT